MRIKVGRDRLQLAAHKRMVDSLIRWAVGGQMYVEGRRVAVGRKGGERASDEVFMSIFLRKARGETERVFAMKKVSQRWETSIQSNDESLRLTWKINLDRMNQQGQR